MGEMTLQVARFYQFDIFITMRANFAYTRSYCKNSKNVLLKGQDEKVTDKKV